LADAKRTRPRLPKSNSAKQRLKRTTVKARVSIGSASVNASALKGLRSAWRNRQLVLFLGAGVSIPYGLPAWKNLVLELLFDQAEATRRLGSLWPHYRRAVASWMTDYFDYDPLVLARMVERDLRIRSARPSTTSVPVADGELLFLEEPTRSSVRQLPSTQVGPDHSHQLPIWSPAAQLRQEFTR
jgi:hypothetical protein